MYIAPQGNIRLLTNVPLEPSYEHTLLFDTQLEQEQYFLSKTHFNLTAQSYTRKGRNALRIEKRADELINCNYLMFKNTGFVQPLLEKWYYAFITDVEYKNNEVSIVYFQLDVMQTWLFDYQLKECFVEREHTVTDNVGDNLVEEDIRLSEYTAYNDGVVPHFENYSIVIATGCVPTLMPDDPMIDSTYPCIDATPKFYNGLYSAIAFLVFPITGTNWETTVSYRRMIVTLNSIKNAGRDDEIIAIYMMPTDFVTDGNLNPTITPTKYEYTMPSEIRLWTYNDNGVVKSPKNKKLYTYPYSYLYVFSSDNNTNEYRAEYFKNGVPKFCLEGAMGFPPQIQLTPIDYNNVNAQDLPNYNESVVLNDYPMCGWVSDTFKAWLAQNRGKIITEAGTLLGGLVLAGTGMSAAASLSTSASTALVPATLTEGAGIGSQTVPYTFNEAPLMGLAKPVGNLTQLISTGISVSQMPNSLKGSYRGVVSLSTKQLGFRCFTMRPRDQQAAMIDDYFSKFGYACKRIKIPNISARPHWNYVKTINCVITGSIPARIAEQIISIYDNGITFWKNPTEVGNYELDNSPVEEED